ncbi:hypothetical protein [Actinacidiphila sp. ITFR-21]|uniref:hypothetical protein n=1 Tax=Actinacidiphila sp. ITFR-21 TaxID=3075199 RepID=UPI0028892E65|nr:hypothetical protein [Streptomyces sp. ITFR-21]WNI16815.1 hypothetical protein RLT57_15680 [Streptomyces sp. ITFR-21]
MTTGHAGGEPAGPADPAAAAAVRAGSVVDLAQRLVRLPSRGGVDGHGPVLEVLETWLSDRAVRHRRLYGGSGALVGLVAEVEGEAPGRWWALDACVDTAPFGDGSAWSFPPTCGDVVDGWLLGRGSADSSWRRRCCATSPPT